MDLVRSVAWKYSPLVACLLLSCPMVGLVGCNDDSQKHTRKTQQALDAAKTKSDALHDAARNLQQMTPLNRLKLQDEVQLHLNKWWQSAPKTLQFSWPEELIDGLPPDLRAQAAFAHEGDGQFDTWDVEYMFQCRLYRKLADWIIERPLRDSLLRPWVEAQAKVLPAEDFAKLEQAFKLFDWTVRNVVLTGNPKDVEKLVDDPRKPVNDAGIGYRYLPWQTILYGRGDFVARGRAFTALTQQREIETCWIGLKLPTSPATKVWAVGVWVGDNCYLFEPKLGLPILDSDTLAPATLAQVQSDEKILKRLDIPGRFDYAVNPGDTKELSFLLDIEPAAGTNRMAVLQSSLTGNDRLALQWNVQPLVDRLRRLMPGAQVSIWQTPLLARLYAKDLRERLTMNSPFTAQYMVEHAVWFMDTPAADARLKHIAGEFESTLDGRGALASYMECRLSDETINRLVDDPDVQKSLQIPRMASESLEQFQNRLRHLQSIFKQAKIDASFLLGQLHFDRGNYSASEDWMFKRTLSNRLAKGWYPAARYTLARSRQEQGKIKEAIDALNEEDSPMEAGNRLRVRYLSK